MSRAADNANPSKYRFLSQPPSAPASQYRALAMTNRLFAALLFALAALPLAAQVNDTYVIPAAANVPGAFGTRWQTRLSIFNPQLDYPLRVSVTFIPTGGGQGDEVLVDVPANAVALWDNVLGSVFKSQNTGALLVATFPEDNPGVPDATLDRAFLVTSETFNNVDSGTYGQTIPGIWAGLMDDGITAIAHGVRNVASQGWRTNIGAVNLGRTSVTVQVTVYDYDGKSVRSNIPFTIPPLGHFQDRLPVEVDRGSIEFTLIDPSKQAVVFPYVSTIDQLSGDPTYQSPVLLASTKTLFPKGAISKDALLSPGKKIDVNFARGVRESARHLGMVVAPAPAARQ
ncbi:MAG TPA: hypothetical protein VII75_06945 [Thermoanaerobaculia bacterium]|nr:hypothetical protein [Thermoanaerobaculia bacterium]